MNEIVNKITNLENQINQYDVREEVVQSHFNLIREYIDLSLNSVRNNTSVFSILDSYLNKLEDGLLTEIQSIGIPNPKEINSILNKPGLMDDILYTETSFLLNTPLLTLEIKNFFSSYVCLGHCLNKLIQESYNSGHNNFLLESPFSDSVEDIGRSKFGYNENQPEILIGLGDGLNGRDDNDRINLTLVGDVLEVGINSCYLDIDIIGNARKVWPGLSNSDFRIYDPFGELK